VSTPASHPLASIDLDRIRPRLHRYCARMVGSVLEGEDLVQATLLRALEAAVPDPPVGNVDAWLFRIAHNLALDHLRRRGRASVETSDDLEEIMDPVDEQARRDATATTLPTFMRLPASQRSVVILFDVLDYSAQEVGDMLHTTIPAVKSILQRGRQRLRTLGDETAVVRPPLSDAETRLLRRYVELFNARDFDGVRTMLAADVKLDLVNRLTFEGPAVREYFTRYAQAQGWTARAGLIEGRPAVLMQQVARAGDTPDYFVVLGWAADRVVSIRDFLFARYALADAEIRAL
jgi:RNA polymerase sigma-70 factor (ECF subfamily)